MSGPKPAKRPKLSPDTLVLGAISRSGKAGNPRLSIWSAWGGNPPPPASHYLEQIRSSRVLQALWLGQEAAAAVMPIDTPVGPAPTLASGELGRAGVSRGRLRTCGEALDANATGVRSPAAAPTCPLGKGEKERRESQPVSRRRTTCLHSARFVCGLCQDLKGYPVYTMLASCSCPPISVTAGQVHPGSVRRQAGVGPKGGGGEGKSLQQLASPC